MKFRPLVTAYRYKKHLLAILVFIILFLLLKLAVVFSVERRTENTEVCSLLRSFGCMTNEFGEIKELRFSRPGSRVEFSSNKTTGIYHYEVLGSLKSGLIRVFWSKDKATSRGVSIEKIEELIGLWQRSVLLYEKK